MLKEEELSYRIRGAVFEVNRILGAGFLESVYRKALVYELRQCGLQAQEEVPISVFYKGKVVGEYRMDIVVENKVVLELKAQPKLPISAEPQLINYLKATGMSVGILVNFTFPKAFLKRIVN
jgi:GxxExxY protein